MGQRPGALCRREEAGAGCQAALGKVCVPLGGAGGREGHKVKLWARPDL